MNGLTDEEYARIFLKVALRFQNKKDFSYLESRFTSARKVSLKEQYINELRIEFNDYITEVNLFPEKRAAGMLGDREIFIRYNDKKTEYKGIHLLIHKIFDSESLSYEESLRAIGKAVTNSRLFDTYLRQSQYSECFNSLEACLLEPLNDAVSRKD